MMTGDTKNQGNALFLVLIAVALFAALSYAVTQSGRGSGSISREQAELRAAEAIQYAGTLQYAMARLTLVGDCTVTNLSFENSVVSGYANTEDPIGDDRCHLFDPAGAGLTWQDPPSDVNDGSPYFFNKTVRVFKTGQGNVGDDLVMFLFNVNQEFCDAVNRKAGLPSTPVDSGNILKGNDEKFDGGFSIADALSGSPNSRYCDNPSIETPNLCGVTTACFTEAANGQQHFMHVLSYDP